MKQAERLALIDSLTKPCSRTQGAIFMLFGACIGLLVAMPAAGLI